MNRRAILTRGTATLAALSAGVLSGFAQARYPDRPIRLVVPFPPGGVVDPIARQWAERIKPYLGTVVIENIGGGGGTIGTTEAAQASPDGHTILLGLTGTLVINPAVMPRVSYNPVRDFAPISVLAISSNVIAINPSIPAKDLKEFIGYAKLNDSKLSYGSAGAATITNLVGELFKQLIGAPGIVHVPYKGAGPSVSDLVSGHIGMATVAATGQLLELHRAGKIRILAVTSQQRLSAAPEIPTAVEAGLSGMIADVFTVLLAPIRTPKPIVEQIYSASQKVMTDPAMQEGLKGQGLQPISDSSPDKALAYLQDEIARWTPLITKLGMKQP
jgi:tripartite-type tricarboxylate transporter receptor subunit TctC